MQALKPISDRELEAIVEAGLDDICARLQAAIGQPDGGPASQFFSGAEYDGVVQMFRRYVAFEYAVARQRDDTP